MIFGDGLLLEMEMDNLRVRLEVGEKPYVLRWMLLLLISSDQMSVL